MKYLVSFVLIFLFGILQSTLIPINLLLVLVILFAVNMNFREGVALAFLAGITKDFMTGAVFGLSSIFFLFAVFLLILYNRKYKLSNLTYLLPFTVAVLVVSDLVFRIPLNLINILGSVIFFTVVSPLIKFLVLRFSGHEKELKLME